jgi:diguanylate cyclase (GGDEF)-like protein
MLAASSRSSPPAVSFAPLLCALAFALALAFRRHRAAQILAAIALAQFALADDGALGLRAVSAATMFAPWLFLAAVLVPEPPLRSRRMLAFAGLLGFVAWLALAAPEHVWRGLEDALPLGALSWRPSRVAGTLCLVASLVPLARWLRRGAPLELALALALALAACAWFDVAGVGFARWLTIAALVAALGVVYSSWRLAFLDALTGLPNRRALDETLARLSGGYALAMVDVDHFKQFNDKHGHDAGDRVLIEVARVLGKTRGAAAFRFGGEEFCLLFRKPDGAAEACEETRAAIEATAVALPKKPAAKSKAGKGTKTKEPQRTVNVTASIGLAARDAKRRSAQEVLKAADQCLYRAKGKGRNQVVAER